MNHFEQILCMGEPQELHYPEEVTDKDSHQQQLGATALDVGCSPFDNSPKPSTFFFSNHSPRQPSDLFQFHPHRRFERDLIPTMDRRLDMLEFQDENSQFNEEDEVSEEELEQSSSQSKPDEKTLPSPNKVKKIQKKKNTKGLKNLSIGVYDIVTAKGRTSYKEVADTLIGQLNKRQLELKGRLKFQDSECKKIEKDEHNIKRRVYDALNVLISAQLLRKEGKDVICNRSLAQSKERSKQARLDQQRSVIIQLERRSRVIEQKREQHLRLLKKREKIEKIMSRNLKLGPQFAEQISFPFIGVKSSFEDIKDINIGTKDVKISYESNDVLLLGDIDLVEELSSVQIKAVQK